MCFERCGFATWCCKTHFNGCMEVAWAWASFWEKVTLFFASLELWLQAAFAAFVRAQFFGWFGILGCRSQWNGRMNVVMLCCYVLWEIRGLRRDVAKRILMAAWRLHGPGLPFGRKWHFFLLHWNCGFKLLSLHLCVHSFLGDLESWVADRSGMAAWMLSCCVAMCFERYGVCDVVLQNALQWLHQGSLVPRLRV